MSQVPRDAVGGLDRQLADALERLGHGLRGMAQQSAQAQGLTPLQQHVLLAIRRLPAGRREVGALAAELNLSPPTVSDAVATLYRKGLIERIVGSDARRRELVLTAAGSETAERVEDWDAPLRAAIARIGLEDVGVALHVVLSVIADLVVDGNISVARTCPGCRFFRRGAPNADHYCGLLDRPLPHGELRVDCPDHEPGAR